MTNGNDIPTVPGLRSLLTQLGCAGLLLAAATLLVSPSHPDRANIAWLALLAPGYAVAYLLALTRGPFTRVCLILFSPILFLIGFAVLSSLGMAGYENHCEGDPCLQNLVLVVLVATAWLGTELGAIAGSIHRWLRDRSAAG